MTVTETTIAIHLRAGCDFESCGQFAFPLYNQLRRGYEECSVLPLPSDIETWRSMHRTARKRADRADRLGYRFEEIQRHEHVDDIYLINTSLQERQGRPMSNGYQETPVYGDDRSPCPMHSVNTYGVRDADHLVAYLWLYRAGDLALVSSILGHGAHLPNDVMWLLIQGAIEAEIPEGGCMVYNRHDSGQDGLRWWKERVGFRPMGVTWQP
jgi:hypothetical protein